MLRTNLPLRHINRPAPPQLPTAALSGEQVAQVALELGTSQLQGISSLAGININAIGVHIWSMRMLLLKRYVLDRAIILRR